MRESACLLERSSNLVVNRMAQFYCDGNCVRCRTVANLVISIENDLIRQIDEAAKRYFSH